MAWWHSNNLRMIQNNLRDIDAGMDVDSYIEELKTFGANTLQIGCGGITSFYPTSLPYQKPSPFMKGDFLGEVVEKCHQNGIRVIARFDFSKLDQCFEQAYPQWWIRRADGDLVRYGDTIFTCVNSEYQQQKSSEIIAEVLRRYPVDGVFFNYFGYINFDYSGKAFGICQCENCRRKFAEMFGVPLPATLDDPDMAEKYEEFKRRTVADILHTVRRTVRAISEDVAISTYTTEQVDIVRNESNTELDRPLPFWVYSSTDNADYIEGGFEEKISSNVSINAVSFAHRYAGVSEHLCELRLYQSLAAGSGLDWCILGGFADYPDRHAFDSVKHVFRYHQRHESCYGRFAHKKRILLAGSYQLLRSSEEYRGLVSMLKQEHLPYFVVDPQVLEDNPQWLDECDFVLLPGLERVSPKLAHALAETSACVVGTGGALQGDAETLGAVFGVREREHITDTNAMYARTAPETRFAALHRDGVRWLYLAHGCTTLALEPGAQGALPLVSRAPFGPPERAYGHVETDEPTAAISSNGNLYVSWAIGGWYYRYGHTELKRALLSLMDSVRPLPRELITDAPEMVEITLLQRDEHAWLLQLVNLTGFNGASFFKPPALAPFQVSFTTLKPRRVAELTEDGYRERSYDGTLQVELKGAYQAFLIEC